MRTYAGCGHHNLAPDSTDEVLQHIMGCATTRNERVRQLARSLLAARAALSTKRDTRPLTPTR